MFELVGIQNVDFKDGNGKEIRGTKLHYLCEPDPDQKSRGFTGQIADSHFFPLGSQLPAALSVGNLYDFILSFNGGKYPKILGVNPVK